MNLEESPHWGTSPPRAALQELVQTRHPARPPGHIVPPPLHPEDTVSVAVGPAARLSPLATLSWVKGLFGRPLTKPLQSVKLYGQVLGILRE